MIEHSPEKIKKDSKDQQKSNHNKLARVLLASSLLIAAGGVTGVAGYESPEPGRAAEQPASQSEKPDTTAIRHQMVLPYDKVTPTDIEVVPHLTQTMIERLPGFAQHDAQKRMAVRVWVDVERNQAAKELITEHSNGDNDIIVATENKTFAQVATRQISDENKFVRPNIPGSVTEFGGRTFVELYPYRNDTSEDLQDNKLDVYLPALATGLNSMGQTEVARGYTYATRLECIGTECSFDQNPGNFPPIVEDGDLLGSDFVLPPHN